MSRKDYKALADIAKQLRMIDKAIFIDQFCKYALQENTKFNEQKFRDACNNL